MGKKKSHEQDFPGGPVVKTPCSQRRGPVSIPDWGTVPHMPRLKTSHTAAKY